MSTDRPTRRDFLKTTSGVAAAGLMPGIAGAGVHSGQSDDIRVALVGCGGRGSGAAVNATRAKGGGVRLVAMADVFQDRLDSSHKNLSNALKDDFQVPTSRQFVGFDAYKRAMDLLMPGDVVILTTPPAFRWVHFQYAIERGLNVFMEKPVTVDGPSSRKMLELNRQAKQKNLKVGVGLMSRHSVGMQQLHRRIQEGEIGDILMMRGYRMHGPAGASHVTPKPEGRTDLEHQIRRFHGFLWASGGCYNDFYIHHIDQMGWMKNAWPVKAQGLGGKHYSHTGEGVPYVDQNFDSYAVEYTWEDGSKLYYEGRCMNGAKGIYSTHLHGTKGLAVCARANDFGGPQATYRSQEISDETRIWQSTDRSSPYQNEWDVLVDRIRKDVPFNEVDRGVYASLVSSMGRMAAHTAQEVTLDEMLNHKHEFAPGVADLDYDSDAPVMPDADGMYPQPQPGRLKDREY